MKRLFGMIIAPVSSLIIMMLGISNLNTFISVILTEEGYSSFVIGLIQASYYTGMIIGALYVEKLIHSKGHIRAFSICAGTVAATIMLQSFSSNPFFWGLCRFISGFCVAGFFITIESWLLLLASPETRGSVLSIYMVALYTGISLGQYGITLVPIKSVYPFNLTAIFCVAAIVPVCLMKAAAPTLVEVERIKLSYLLKKTPLGFFGNLVAGLMLGAFYALGPVFATNSGCSISQVSSVMAVTILGGMMLQWPIGKLSDLCPRRLVILLICTCLCFLSLIIVFFPEIHFTARLALLFVYGGFLFTVYPISITYCCDFFNSSGIMSVTSAALLVFGVGSIFGPIACPPFLNFLGPTGLFIYMTLLAALLGVLCFYRWQTAPPPPPETTEHYHVHPDFSGNLSDNSNY